MKKCLFICDWDYTPFWEKVAKMMQAQNMIGTASALVVGKIFHDELKKNKHPFSNIYLLQEKLEAAPEYIENCDAKLSALEEKYSEQSLWRFVWADRSWVKCSYDEIKKRLVACFHYFEELLEAEKPDIIFTNAYASMPHLILFEVARKKGIPIIRPLSARLGKKYFISDNAMEEETWISQYISGERQASEQAITEAKAYLESFRARGDRPAYQVQRDKEHHVTLGHFYRFFRYVYRYFFTDTFKGDHTKKGPFSRIKTELSWRLLRRKLVRRSYWDQYDPTEKYIFFPLHVQPEMSTMTYAPYYLDQVAIIENIAKSLPVHYRLVVKEHPSMLGRRELSYYDRIRAVPNVRMIFPLEDSYQVIKQSQLLFTITGTAGLEGLLLKKPVIALGSIFFKQCPLIFDASGVAPTKWRELILNALNHYQCDETVLLNFLSAVFDRSFEGSYEEPLANPGAILNEANLQILIDAIQDYLIKKPIAIEPDVSVLV